MNDQNTFIAAEQAAEQARRVRDDLDQMTLDEALEFSDEIEHALATQRHKMSPLESASFRSDLEAIRTRIAELQGLI
ncbi:MAG: hypothetical protein JOY78_20290 [Pseudonocardia sp.]|nr:hypothetical protein [Pseudonocardia sp.]